MRKIWLNGEILPETEAKVSIYDTAMMQGYVFEMTRSFNNQQFKIVEHINRLLKSCEYIGLNLPWYLDVICDACDKVVEANKFNSEHRLIINASHGLLSTYQNVEGAGHLGANLMIIDVPLRWTVKGMGKYFDEGLSLKVANQKAIPSFILDNRLKHHNRLHSLLANREITEPDTWPLFTDLRGFVTECPGANILVVDETGKKIISPKPAEILDGVSKNYVKFLCKGVLEYEERDLLPYDLLQAREIWVTATPFCMLPIVNVNGVQIGNGKPGAWYRTMLDSWTRQVSVDIKKQIQDWNKEDGEVTGPTPYQFKEKK